MTLLQRYYQHLKSQPCLRCNAYGCEVAHIQAFPSKKHSGDMPRRVGLSDYAAIPLCPGCHRHASDSIHNVGERAFMESLGKTRCYVFKYLARNITEFFLKESGGKAP